MTVALLTFAVTIAVPALADDDSSTFGKTDRERTGMRLDRTGDRIDTRLDEKAFRISEYYARQAARAEQAGKLGLAHRLQVKGEQFRQDYDRKGDRIDARLDRRGEHNGRYFDKGRCDDNFARCQGDRHNRRLAWQDDHPRRGSHWHRSNDNRR
jgi:hypothetical protein